MKMRSKSGDKCLSNIRGGSGAHPPKIGKNTIFCVKSWFFTRNTSKDFFKCTPLPPNLKSWIRPWTCTSMINVWAKCNDSSLSCKLISRNWPKHVNSGLQFFLKSVDHDNGVKIRWCTTGWHVNTMINVWAKYGEHYINSLRLGFRRNFWSVFIWWR